MLKDHNGTEYIAGDHFKNRDDAREWYLVGGAVIADGEVYPIVVGSTTGGCWSLISGQYWPVDSWRHPRKAYPRPERFKSLREGLTHALTPDAWVVNTDTGIRMRINDSGFMSSEDGQYIQTVPGMLWGQYRRECPVWDGKYQKDLQRELWMIQVKNRVEAAVAGEADLACLTVTHQDDTGRTTGFTTSVNVCKFKDET